MVVGVVARFVAVGIARGVLVRDSGTGLEETDELLLVLVDDRDELVVLLIGLGVDPTELVSLPTTSSIFHSESSLLSSLRAGR